MNEHVRVSPNHHEHVCHFCVTLDNEIVNRMPHHLHSPTRRIVSYAINRQQREAFSAHRASDNSAAVHELTCAPLGT